MHGASAAACKRRKERVEGEGTYLPHNVSSSKATPSFPFLWQEEEGRRKKGTACHAENVVYFYDNARVDVGRKREGGKSFFALSIRGMEE